MIEARGKRIAFLETKLEKKDEVLAELTLISGSR